MSGPVRSVAPTEAADGTPHLAYYRAGVSFVWSGAVHRPIQVCPGGYGEPVQAEIWPTNVGTKPPVLYTGALIVWFTRVCDRWLEER